MGHKNSLGSGLQIRKIMPTAIFPTLFSKLFTLYLSILLGIMIFFVLIFSDTFQEFFVDYTLNIMINQAETIEEEFQKISDFDGIEQIFVKIQVLDSYLDSTTWLVDKKNTMLMVSEKNDRSPLGRKIPDQDAIQKVFQGTAVKITTGFEQYFSTPVLTVGYPIRLFGKVQYALFIHTPMPQILSTIDEVRMIIFQVASITSVIIFVAIYLISKQMTKPLKEMNDVAKRIASGELDKRIEVKGQDEIAQLAGTLNYMATELDKIEEKRRMFIANVSHDLRSPLTSIQGFITAILDGTIPCENQEKYLNIVLSESQRMIKMANDILELSRMEENTMPLKRMEFDVHEMIKDILLNFETRTKEKNIQLKLILDKREQIVLADPEKIVRVIQNLLDNAFKFVNEQGVIEIETKAKQNKVWIFIRNSGPSIPKEEQNQIWDKFYKADLSRGVDKRGMGLGLGIVKEVIKQHGEEIGLKSESGEMVNFYFSLTRI
ncbi:MAG: sensor histidine kinase [Cellulosilyticaceae bacterium]